MSQIHDSNIPISIFYSYSHRDKAYRDKLKTHLSVMKRQGLISMWHDEDIMPGQEWTDEINKHLKIADVILLLVSPDFMDSDYCYSIEMEFAIQRHEAGEACVIPIILRPCEWSHSPLSRFQALPYRAKPVSKWTNRDEAFNDIAQGIRRVVNSLRKSKGGNKATLKNEHSITVPATKPLPKSKNRSLNKLLQKKREDRSVGERVQGTLELIASSFSISEIGKRAKGFSLVLLFLFTVLDIIILPYFIYQWVGTTICILSSIIFGIFFLMGITNKNGAVAYFATFTFFVIWLLIGIVRIIGYYHLLLPLYWLVIIISLLSLLQLALFRPRNRRRRFPRIV
jgi:hypothetical protein